MEMLWDINELGKFINVKAATLRKYVALRKIPFVKVGRLVRFSPSEIEQWLTHCKVPVQTVREPTGSDNRKDLQLFEQEFVEIRENP
jgi:excisionase family DNA binding protein